MIFDLKLLDHALFLQMTLSDNKNTIVAIIHFVVYL